MAVIDHWHPVCRVAALRRGPASVTIDGHRIAVFRTAAGALGALDEVCPHRHMRLSLGTVCGERLQCKYHGWTYDTQGNGESPGTPKLHATTGHYDVREGYGWAWVRAAGAQTPFPTFDTDGFTRIGEFDYSFDVPLELVVDNFTEAEHTGTVHVFFGYPTERLHEVDVKFTWTDDSVTVVNYGPHKPMPWLFRRLMGIRKHWFLIDDWTTYFAPLYSVYNYHYDDPVTHRRGLLHQRSVFFFVPEGPKRTRVVVFLYFQYRLPVARRLAFLFHPLLRKIFDYEVVRDQRLLAGLADYDPSIERMKLSRFDKVLGLNRERIERVYRGNSLPVGDTAAEAPACSGCEANAVRL
jgi:phenylpropionate dioxygenase-like ring-hydroxylating dioxygenase large terminal subunit